MVRQEEGGRGGREGEREGEREGTGVKRRVRREQTVTVISGPV